MVSFVDLSKKYTNPRDQAWREGKGPYKGSLGPNKTPEDPLRDQWTAEMRDNVDWKNFSADSYTFPGETAAAAQQKIDDSAWDSEARFTNPGDNAFAKTFLDNYLDRGDGNSAEGRGLIEEDRIVRPENLDQVATSFAASGNAKSDPNVVGEFPRDDVAV
jgi:hypothetical protein